MKKVSKNENKSLSLAILYIKSLFRLIFAMSHHRTNLWYSSLKIVFFLKSSERIDEVSDPLYFLKDQTSQYINISISFSKKVKIQALMFA